MGKIYHFQVDIFISSKSTYSPSYFSKIFFLGVYFALCCLVEQPLNNARKLPITFEIKKITLFKTKIIIIIPKNKINRKKKYIFKKKNLNESEILIFCKFT